MPKTVFNQNTDKSMKQFEAKCPPCGEMGDADDRPTCQTVFSIPFSVYTASNGYDWSNIPEGADRDGLDYYYQKAVAFKPDFMVSGDVVKGVFAQNDCIAAFRIQIVKHWDDFGRDAEYCAFAFFFGYEQAKRVDFEALLEIPEFRNPSHEPPTVISYQELPSKDIDSAQSISDIKDLFRGATLKSFDFAKIGALISAHGGKCERWLFSKVESSFENTVSVSTGKWSATTSTATSTSTAAPDTTIDTGAAEFRRMRSCGGSAERS